MFLLHNNLGKIICVFNHRTLLQLIMQYNNSKKKMVTYIGFIDLQCTDEDGVMFWNATHFVWKEVDQTVVTLIDILNNHSQNVILTNIERLKFLSS